MKFLLSFLIVCALLNSCSSINQAAIRAADLPSLQGITFAVEKGRIYLPLTEVEARLGRITPPWKDDKATRTFTDGTSLVSLVELSASGISVVRDPGGKKARLRRRSRQVTVVVGSKHAQVSLSEQRLRAWQGGRLVLLSRVSSGKNSRTPRGHFRAGPYKARRHYSSLYDNAPMPWSVQVTGHVFIHGFSSVPDYPASHGCIRVPLNEGNPAKFFYEWVSLGTPIRVK